ncbi:putative adhesin [Nocardiopsis sp. Huas11]|uniref:DUF4097 family beta strand repeat-containing protein n=1 Tax=Nocardiopsis sp. Huas11 TaxID=2183912 RepID=UPI000EB1BE62|nr:DUF4097 family beta strand repeat-containing protein [Nocardiopsis sp. Huas11]RKS08765.1 putative adhesin [Nocardiopsis sp. Huas11]
MTFKARGLYASSSKEPRRSRVGLWLVLGLVVVAAVGLVTAAAVLGRVGLDRGNQVQSVDAPTAVEIENETGGSVELTGTTGPEMVVERQMHGSPLKEPVHEVEENEGQVHVEAHCEGVPFIGQCSVDYTIAVPEGTAVSVETIGGPITVSNVDGALELSTTSGRVNVDGNVGDVEVESTSGSVELDGVEGSANVETTSGSVTAAGAGASLDVSTVSGSLDLSGFSADVVQAESTSGTIAVGGGFTTAEVSTTSGNIAVDTEDAFDLLTLDTVSGSSQVEVPDGAYRITGESVSGDRSVGVDTSPDADAHIDANAVSGSLTVN